jgi:hypothetical protein
MGRRFLSHVLIMFAVFILTATFFMWTIDSRVLEPNALAGELRKAGVSQELAKLMPEIVTGDKEATSPAELEDIKSKVSQAVTAEYVDIKITEISNSILTFVREGEPEPVIDLRDFPERLVALGVNIDDDFKENFNEPVQLNKDGKLDNLNKGYETFKLVKYAGLALFVILMLAEWFTAERGQKLKRTSRIFLYAGVSYLIYWVALVVAPGRLSGTLLKNVDAEYDTTGLIDSVLRAVQGVFSGYFLMFTITCLTIALVLYIIRHYRHGDVLPGSSQVSKKPRKK